MPIPLRFAFQGGGAKFVTLLAAAKAIYDLSRDDKNPLTIDRLAGTSAGAIAAGILASGIDPAIIRNYLRTTGETHRIAVLQHRFWMKSAYRLFVNGLPLYDYSGLLNFVEETLEAGAIRRDLPLSETRYPIAIVASNLSTRNSYVYSSDSDGASNERLATAIANSCALPIIFKNTRGAIDNHLVDGGIIDNLPIRHLLTSFDASRVVAFSFENPPPPTQITSLKDYILCLIDTSIAANINTSTRMLDNSNIIPLPFSYNTMDFPKALNSGLGDHFDLVYEKVRQQVMAIVDREARLEFIRDNRQTSLSRSINERRSASEIFKLVDIVDMALESIEVELTLDSLRHKQDSRHNSYDRISTTYHVSLTAPCTFVPFPLHLSSNTDKIDFTLSEIEVVDETGRRIDFTPLVGEIYEFADSYSIPIYIFIRSSDLSSGINRLTIRHIDHIERALPKFSSASTGTEVTEVIAMVSSHKECGRVEWRVHFPDFMFPSLSFGSMKTPDEEVKIEGTIDGDFNNDIPGAPFGFRTVQWCSRGVVNHRQAAGFVCTYAKK